MCSLVLFFIFNRFSLTLTLSVDLSDFFLIFPIRLVDCCCYVIAASHFWLGFDSRFSDSAAFLLQTKNTNFIVGQIFQLKHTHTFTLVLSISQSHSLQIGFGVVVTTAATETYISFSVFNEVHLNGNVFYALSSVSSLVFPSRSPSCSLIQDILSLTQLCRCCWFFDLSFSFHFICGRHA